MIAPIAKMKKAAPAAFLLRGFCCFRQLEKGRLSTVLQIRSKGFLWLAEHPLAVSQVAQDGKCRFSGVISVFNPAFAGLKRKTLLGSPLSLNKLRQSG